MSGPIRIRPSPWRVGMQILVLVVGLIPGPVAAEVGACLGSRSVHRGYALPPGTGEVSGFTASMRYPEWAWMIRDSGQPASLYAVNLRGALGHVVREVRVAGARNVDWEDIAYAQNPDGTGRLYVVESGQSGRSRFIFKIPEPDPRSATEAARYRRYAYVFPNNEHFNVEAALFHDDRLTLVTKTAPARLYRFEERLDDRRVNRPRFVGVLRGSNHISLARLSSSGTTLVTANHRSMSIYRAPDDGRGLDKFAGRAPASHHEIGANDNIEAGDFLPVTTCHMVLLAESKQVYRVVDRSRSSH